MDLVTPAVAGAAGALIKEVAQHGVEWLIRLVAAHSPEVQARARANAENFLVRLADRVERLEAELPTDDRSIFEAALGHPSTSLLIQKAFTAAAATDRDERHQILSELIAQRLTTDADDLIALAGAAACDIVLALAPRHIRLLGVMALVWHLKPRFTAPQVVTGDAIRHPVDARNYFNPPEGSSVEAWWSKLAGAQRLAREQYANYVSSVEAWWNRHLGALSTVELDRVHYTDLLHLAALSCLSVTPQVSRLEADVFRIQYMLDELQQEFLHRLFKADWWKRFERVWNLGVKTCTLTTVGILIGALHHDSVLGVHTPIAWDTELRED